MKPANLFLLLLGLSLAFSAKSQVAPLPDELVKVKTPSIDIAETLRHSANPRYMVLERVTHAYHQPADTASGRYFKLWPGTKVYIRDWAPDGLLIDLGFGSGEKYYLPNNSVKGLRVFVEI
ncbi:hypothetical protein ACFQ48_09675 [Hymenobacter caeli]|uniref:Uncharacterized protein n=1 Tax=Hymenobacter caeli TaxID=2735894 RepID=A0ABX2FMU6_9BACT|nr:hypothetical protein [Hymenobacter caeli]NRT18341.1 hypothetical protein [Hymenobacter caeli]